MFLIAFLFFLASFNAFLASFLTDELLAVGPGPSRNQSFSTQ